MATAIKIPDMGTTVDRVTLLKWLKKEGDAVKRGEVLCEIETDKATNELESIAQGVLLKALVQEGTEVDQGSIVAYVGANGEQVPTDGTKDASAGQPAGAPRPQTATPAAGKAPKVAPVVANIAKKYGIDLSTIEGTGPGGRITRDDVLRAKDGRGAATSAATAAPPPPARPAPTAVSPAPAVSGQAQPLPANQIVVARRVSRSQREIPPVAIDSDVDMSHIIRLREGILASGSKKVCFDAFFAKALGQVMAGYPHLRSRLEGESVVASDTVTVGVAIGIGHDLFIPVIRSPETKSIPEIDAEIRALAAKAEAGSFSQQELTGATVTISNLGMFPVRRFSAIIPPDQIGILSIGAVKETLVVNKGAISIAPMAPVTLSVNHCLINGREAGEIVARLREALHSL